MNTFSVTFRMSNDTKNSWNIGYHSNRGAMAKGKCSLQARKLHIRRNNNKVDSTETARIVVADLISWSDLEKVHEHHAFLINDDKILLSLLNLYIQLYLFALLNDA